MRYYRSTLAGRALRMRQNLLVAAGLLGAVLLPFITVTFLPTLHLLRSNEAITSFYAVAFLQAMSWALIVLQSDALAHPPSEHLINTWPVPRATRMKLDLHMMLIGNHLLWLITLPALAWFLFTNGDMTQAGLNSLKLIVALGMIVPLQVRTLGTGQVPALRLLTANLLYFCALVLVQETKNDLAHLALLFALLSILAWPSIPTRRKAFHQRRTNMSWRKRVTTRAPWIGLYLLMVISPAARSQLWRFIAAIAIVAASGPAVANASRQNALLILTVMVFALIYLVNGLYYHFDKCHQQALPLLRSWGVTRRALLKLDLLVFAYINTVLLSVLLCSVLPMTQVNVWHALFLIGCSVTYLPVLLLIAIRSPENVLAYSVLAYFPVCVAALKLA